MLAAIRTRGGRAVSMEADLNDAGAPARLFDFAEAELASFGITANIVYPPVTDTGWVDDAIREGVQQSSTLIHVVGPEDVAEVIAFLCSDHA